MAQGRASIAEEASMNTMTKTGLDLVTDHGLNLPENMPEARFFELGTTLGNIERGMQWAIGDWYNAIPAGKGNQYTGEEGKKAACERVGLDHRSARDYAVVCRTFATSSRDDVALPFSHFKRLAISDLTAAQRRDLLKRAAAEGWSSKVLVDERDKVLGTYEAPVKVDSKEAIGAFVESAMPTLPAKYQKQVGRALKSAAHKLADDFEETVKTEVDKRTKEDRERVGKLMKDAQAKMDAAVKLRAGAGQFMTVEEFKLVRACLHPDKHKGDPRYVKAFEIFNRLAEQMGGRRAA